MEMCAFLRMIMYVLVLWRRDHTPTCMSACGRPTYSPPPRI